jgi:hypothetical protein
MMRKLIIPVIILFVVVLLFIGYYYPTVFFGDSSKTKGKNESAEIQINSKRVSSLVSSLDFYSSSNLISLLSVKYSMSSDTLIDILSEYNNQAKPDYDFDSFKLTEIKNNMKNDVNDFNANLTNIAKKFNIQPTTLVNIIIDYKLLKNTNK